MPLHVVVITFVISIHIFYFSHKQNILATECRLPNQTIFNSKEAVTQGCYAQKAGTQNNKKYKNI